MMSPQSRQRRASVEWGVRIALAVVAVLLGYSAVTRSVAYAIRGRALVQAHWLAPRDGRITALLSEQQSGPEASASQRAKADQIARLALRQDGTAVPAAATLGINASIRGDTDAARRWFGHAQHLSRRDLRTQLWAIEDAVTRNDIPRALHHYDIALRTSRVAPELLFPVLSAAIETPEIRAALVRTLAARPTWTAGFIGYAALNGPDPRATAQLFQALPAWTVVTDDARAMVVDRLITGRYFDDAWAFYAAQRAGADRHRSRDPRFTATLTAPSMFDWTAMNDGGVVTSIQRGPRGGIAAFEAPQSVGGMALRQAQMLPPGEYALQGRASGMPLSAGSRPYWALGCLDGRVLGQVDVPDLSEAGVEFAGRFTVPADCRLQYLSLVLRPSDVIDGVRGQIDTVRLVPAG